MCLQKLSYNLTEKTIWKMTKLKNPNMLWKQIFPKVKTDLKFQQKAIDEVATLREANWACYYWDLVKTQRNNKYIINTQRGQNIKKFYDIILFKAQYL